MVTRPRKPWLALALGLLAVAAGSSDVTKFMGAARRDDADLLRGVLSLVLGVGALIAVCQHWDRGAH